MERQERLEWLQISQQINKTGSGVYKCPRNEEHILEYEIKDFPDFNKREIHLVCKRDNVHLTFTLDKI